MKKLHNLLIINEFNQSVEDKYNSTAKKLEQNKFKYGYELKSDDFINIINEISNIYDKKNIEDFNILYDSKINKFKLYEDGVWANFIIEYGMQKIIITIQDALLDTYEFYLIRNITSSKFCQKRQELIELLEEYYKFIGCFDVNPAIKNKSDGYILEDRDDDNTNLSEKYWKMYTDIRDKITKSEVNAMNKKIINIIKFNTVENITQLNKQIVELFQMDDNFKNAIKL